MIVSLITVREKRSRVVVSDPGMGSDDFPLDWWARLDKRRRSLAPLWMKPAVQVAAVILLLLAFAAVLTDVRALRVAGATVFIGLLALNQWLCIRPRDWWPRPRSRD